MEEKEAAKPKAQEEPKTPEVNVKSAQDKDKETVTVTVSQDIPRQQESREPGIWISQKSLSSLSVPFAIVIAGALVAGSIYFSGSRSGGTVSPKTKADTTTTTQPSTGTPTAPSARNDQGGAVVNVSQDDDPSKGSADAPVTIIEFSDFQCPFCRRFFEDTLPQIDSDYIKTGKVKFVYRDFPLSFHEMAQTYAEAGECADDQGKFWAMHDKIFEKQSERGSGTVTGITATDVKQWAKDAGLNGALFDQCLDSGKHAEEVKKDLADGQAAGVSGTPGFFVNGRSVVGAQPFGAFKTIIDEELARAQ